mmetsp:Transcript_8608/g.14513  ORF Transcript_8608/g.14513 Transcript_8608/m.14513 type:complete len:206 (-) Transcript_8608:205-822(-)
MWSTWMSFAGSSVISLSSRAAVTPRRPSLLRLRLRCVRSCTSAAWTMSAACGLRCPASAGIWPGRAVCIDFALAAIDGWQQGPDRPRGHVLWRRGTPLDEVHQGRHAQLQAGGSDRHEQGPGHRRVRQDDPLRPRRSAQGSDVHRHRRPQPCTGGQQRWERGPQQARSPSIHDPPRLNTRGDGQRRPHPRLRKPVGLLDEMALSR